MAPYLGGGNQLGSSFSDLDNQSMASAFGTQLAGNTAQQANYGAMGAQAGLLQGLFSGNQQSMGILQNLLGMLTGSGSSSSSQNGGGFGDLLNKELGNIDQMGAGRTNDINQAYHDSVGAGLSALSDKGIGGGSFTTDAYNSSERDRQSSLNQLNDQLLGAKNQAYNTVGMAGANAQQQSRMQILSPFLSSLLG